MLTCHDALDRLVTVGPDDAPPGDWATHYVAHGIAVLPIHPPAPDGACTCGPRCIAPGKHPMTPNGVRDATTDLRTVTTWWRFRPDANVGIVPPPGVVVLDVDPRNGGATNLLDLLAGERLAPTWACATGGAGLHAWYRHDGDVVKLPGVDVVRGPRRYLVAPPSLHASGRRYRWITEQATADLPAVLHRTPDPVSEPVTDGPNRPPRGEGPGAAFGRGHGLVRTVRDAPEGARNNRLHWAACRAWEAGGDPELLDLLADAAAAAGLRDGEISATMASAARTIGGAA